MHSRLEFQYHAEPHAERGPFVIERHVVSVIVLNSGKIDDVRTVHRSIEADGFATLADARAALRRRREP